MDSIEIHIESANWAQTKADELLVHYKYALTQYDKSRIKKKLKSFVQKVDFERREIFKLKEQNAGDDDGTERYL